MSCSAGKIVVVTRKYTISRKQTSIKGATDKRGSSNRVAAFCDNIRKRFIPERTIPLQFS